MPSRAAHTKSRAGCLRCKQRRVKCDEGAPCRDCNRRNECCSLVTDPIYIASFAGKDAPFGVPVSPSSSTASGVIPISSRSYPASSSTRPVSQHDFFSSSPTNQIPLHQTTPHADWAEDLHLMAHWVHDTSNTILKRPAVTNLYQKVGPEIAVSFPAAMHTMLAVSALHLAYLRPQERTKYITVSSRHQQNALQKLSGAIHEITKQTIVPVFLTSALLPCCCLADMSQRSRNVESPPVLDDVLAVFSMIRGVRDVLYPVWPWLFEPDIQPLIEPIIDQYFIHNNETYSLPTALAERMHILRNTMLDDLAAYHDGSKEACHFALLELEKVMRDIAHMPPSTEGTYSRDYRRRTDIELGVLLKWQTTVSATYVDLLKKSHMAALVVLAHWVMLIKHLGAKWFLEGWIEGVMGVIGSTIAEEGRAWLEWPLEYVKEGVDEATEEPRPEDTSVANADVRPGSTIPPLCP